MEGQAPQIGTYQVLGVHAELHNGKPVFADVIFKGPEWTNFDFTPRKLRLIGLFNKSSIGPKEEFKGKNSSNLKYYFINIIRKVEDRENKKYSIEWEAYKPANYDELLLGDMDRIADLFEEQHNTNDTEVYTIEMEELISQQNQDNELGNLDNGDLQFDQDDNVIM